MSFSGEDEGSHTDETDRESSVNTVEEPPENLLAKALKSITFDEQQSAIHDIHGVSVINQEDPKMVQQKLIEMEEEISKIKSKDAYLKAKASSPEFGEFLRSLRYFLLIPLVVNHLTHLDSYCDSTK